MRTKGLLPACTKEINHCLLHFLPFLAIPTASEFQSTWKSRSGRISSDTGPGNNSISSGFKAEQSSLSLPYELASEAISTHTLDAVPRPCLRAFIRRLQLSTSSGSSLLLGFSTLSAPLSLWSPLYVLAAVPFLPCDPSNAKSHIMKHSHKRPSRRRTLLPLQSTLDHILRELISGSSPFNVQYVQNVSAEYAEYLSCYLRELEEDDDIRSAFVTKWGLDAWREERFLLAWEAALFTAGLLTRWIILARR